MCSAWLLSLALPELGKVSAHLHGRILRSIRPLCSWSLHLSTKMDGRESPAELCNFCEQIHLRVLLKLNTKSLKEEKKEVIKSRGIYFKNKTKYTEENLISSLS